MTIEQLGHEDSGKWPCIKFGHWLSNTAPAEDISRCLGYFRVLGFWMGLKRLLKCRMHTNQEAASYCNHFRKYITPPLPSSVKLMSITTMGAI